MQRFIFEADLDAVSAESALILAEDAALRKLHDLVKIVRAQFLADDAHRQAADEFRLETVLDEVLGGDELEQLVIHHLPRLGVEPDLALGEAPRDLLLQALERPADDEQEYAAC